MASGRWYSCLPVSELSRMTDRCAPAQKREWFAVEGEITYQH